MANVGLVKMRAIITISMEGQITVCARGAVIYLMITRSHGDALNQSEENFLTSFTK